MSEARILLGESMTSISRAKLNGRWAVRGARVESDSGVGCCVYWIGRDPGGGYLWICSFEGKYWGRRQMR